MPLSDKRGSWCTIVQDNIQEGSIDVQPAIVTNEAQFPEFVHEKVASGTRCADHLRQRFLRYFGAHSAGLVDFTIPGKQQKSAGEPFLARIEKLVDQILLDSDVP